MNCKLYFFLLCMILFFANKTNAQTILPIDSCFGTWQIDSMMEFTEDFKSSAIRMNTNVFDSLVRIISIGTFTINANHSFTYVSGFKEMSIKNGVWRQNNKNDWIEIADKKVKDFSLMRFDLLKRQEMYYIEMQDLFFARIKKIK
jgi:hypothetical protein